MLNNGQKQKEMDEHVHHTGTCTVKLLNETHGPQQSPENNVPGIVAIVLLIYHIYYSV